MRISLILVGTFIGCVSSVSLGQASRPGDKPRLAIVDFCIKGDVGIKDAGEVVSERLLMQMGQDHYQLVERSQLAALLKEIDLTIALVRDNPEKVYGKLKGIRFIVLGSVNKLGSIAISARLVNVATGDIVQTAEVLARDAQGLEDALGELAKVLLMTEQEKKDYLGKRPIATLPSAKEKDLTLDLGNNVTMKLTLIPAGKFMMGSPDSEKGRKKDEGPQREVTTIPSIDELLAHVEDYVEDTERPQRQVTITNPFYMGVHEVTRGQFARFAGDSRHRTYAEKEGKAYGWDGSDFGEMGGYSWRKTGFEQTDEHPVVNVSWNDAVEFCKWLSLKSGRMVRLPTEAQWEYSCRGGSTTAYPWGDSPDDGKGWANAADQTARKQFGMKWPVFNWDDRYAFTAPVGRFRANAFGLHDMIGNVSEWCSDWHANSYANANNIDPAGPNSGTLRVVRGGGWHSSVRECRSASRSYCSPVFGLYDIGFRVVVDLK